jgi:hypothetical protein
MCYFRPIHQRVGSRRKYANPGRSQRFAATAAALMSLLSTGAMYADTLPFGVVGSPIDLSTNVKEAILPGGTAFEDSKPFFGTEPNPKQPSFCTFPQRA